MKKLLLNLFGLAAIAVSLNIMFNRPDPAATSSDSTSTAATAATAAPQSAKPQSATIPKGQWVDVRNDRSIRVDNSGIAPQLATSNQFIQPLTGKGGKLAIVYLSLKNTGKESGNMFWTQFQLIDSQGRKYSEIADFEELMAVNDWLKAEGLEDGSSQIFPGGTVQTAKVFRVSPDAEGLILEAGGKQLSLQ